MVQIRTYEVGIEGLSPLIMHWDNIQWADQMSAWQTDPANKGNSKAGEDRTPAFRWIGSLYHDNNVVCIPADNLMRCMMEGGAMVPTGKGPKTFKAQTQSGMNVGTPYSPLRVDGQTIPWADIQQLQDEPSFDRHVEAVQDLGFSLFIKRAKVGANKHVRVRPRFDRWALTFRLIVWDDQLTESVLHNVITYAGQYKGLCDWRPGSPKSPGSFGMFKLASLERV